MIRPAVHRVLDLLTVIGFAVAPFILRLSGPAAWLAWVLAAVHLLMTLATSFPGRAPGRVPFRLHGGVELLVGIVLPVVPFVAGWTGAARWFYVVVGIVILLVRLATRFTVRDEAESPRPAPSGERLRR